MTHTQAQCISMTESKIIEKILKVVKKERKIQKDKENIYSPVHLLETMGARSQVLKEKHQSNQNSFI